MRTMPDAPMRNVRAQAATSACGASRSSTPRRSRRDARPCRATGAKRRLAQDCQAPPAEAGLRSGAGRGRGVRSPNDGASDPDLRDLEIIVSIEETEPGSVLDERLRREQARAFLRLLASYAATR
jgi:hypothetical protein